MDRSNAMKQPTQNDVARLAGVSRATVSYVINDKDKQGIVISDETRQRVLAAVDQLGYVINAGAQALRSGDTKTIGVMLPLYENPFFWEILKGVSNAANEAGYKVLLANSALDPEQTNQTITELAEQRIDGLILLMEFASLPARVMDQLRSSSHPIVEGSSSVNSDFDLILQDYSEGMHAILSHLFELGHRRVGYLHGVQESTTQGQDRLSAFRKAFVDAGLAYDPSWIYRCGQSLDEGYQKALEILQQPGRPTAIVAINDLLAIACIRAAADLGIHVPGDLSIASFDDIPFARFSVPRLTTIQPSPEQNGRDAVRLLLKRLEDPDREREIVRAGWRLHVRESTGPVPDKIR
jgi:LacI family transcriptional regulator